MISKSIQNHFVHTFTSVSLKNGQQTQMGSILIHFGIKQISFCFVGSMTYCQEALQAKHFNVLPVMQNGNKEDNNFFFSLSVGHTHLDDAM